MQRKVSQGSAQNTMDIESSNTISSKELQSSPIFKKTKCTTCPCTCRQFVVIFIATCSCLVILFSAVLLNISTLTLEKKNMTDKFTIVINTFKRHEMLSSAIDYYSKCHQHVESIHITWSESTPPPESLKKKLNQYHTPLILFDEYTTDSLNNRFIPLTSHFTNAIFAVDDDMRVPCSDLELAFETWLNNQQAIVGFMPRIHVIQNGLLQYRCWWSVWVKGAYSIMLTKAAFLHHNYFDLYTNHMPKTIHQFIDHGMNCEDIAMQYLVTNHTSLPPVYVKGHIYDLGVLGGISTSRNIVTAAHMDARSNCLNQLSTLFGKTPLVYSHTIVDSAANGWFNAPSTWSEYISSDLWNFF